MRSRPAGARQSCTCRTDGVVTIGRQPKGEVYFEFYPVGRQVKVTAIDADTGIEVVVLGPVQATQADLQQLALRKLMRRLAQEAPAR